MYFFKIYRTNPVVLILLFLLFGVSSLNSQVIADKQLDKVFSDIDFNTIYYPEKAELGLDSLMKSFSDEEVKSYSGYLHYIKAQFLYNDLQVDSSLHYLELAISFFTKLEHNKWLGNCQFLLGSIAEVTGLMEQAKINYYEAIALSGSSEVVTSGLSYLGIARCKRALKESFQEELDAGIEKLESVEIIQYRLFVDFMKQLFQLNSKDSPSILKVVAKSYIEIGMPERAVNVYKVIASSFYAQDSYDSAHYYCDKALDVGEKYVVGKLILPALYQFKGVLYYKQESYRIAEAYFSRSLELYKNNSQRNRMLYTYNYLHKIDVAKDNYAKAYENLNEYLKLTKEISSKEKIRLAKVLEINNKVDLMRSQLVQLKIEKKASEFMLYLVVVITIVIFGGLGIYIYMYQKNKKAKIEELNKEFHNLLIGIGEKQLLEHRLNSGTTRKNSKEVPVTNIPAVVVDEGDIGDSFDTCYMETINLFTESFPQLTKTEVRYSVMICLKLPIEVIAKVQNVQPSSIRKAKQRIRTKLNVGDNLEVYLQEFREKQISDLAS